MNGSWIAVCLMLFIMLLLGGCGDSRTPAQKTAERLGICYYAGEYHDGYTLGMTWGWLGRHPKDACMVEDEFQLGYDAGWNAGFQIRQIEK